MTDKIRIGDKWYVSATSARTEESPQVLKQDETFVLFDHFGDVQVAGPGEQGLYDEDTRYLSYQELLVDGVRPLYLGSTVKENNSLLIVELMNPDLTRGGEVRVPKGTVHIFRAKLLWQGACYEHIRLTNHGREPVETTLAIAFDADFVDLFEVRGVQRERRGTVTAEVQGQSTVVLRYTGLDGVVRLTRIEFSPAPSSTCTARSPASEAAGKRPRASPTRRRSSATMRHAGRCAATAALSRPRIRW